MPKLSVALTSQNPEISRFKFVIIYVSMPLYARLYTDFCVPFEFQLSHQTSSFSDEIVILLERASA